MNRERIFWVATLLSGFIVQVVFAPMIAVRGVFPNLLLLGTIFFSVRGGPVVGEWTGFMWGFLLDVSSISIFGSQTFMMTLIGYMTGRLRGKIDEGQAVAQMVLVLVMSFFYILGLFFFETLFGGSVQRFKVGISFLQPIYTALVSPVLFWALLRWSAFFHWSNMKGDV